MGINWNDLGVEEQEMQILLDNLLADWQKEQDEPGDREGVSPKEIVKIVANRCDDLQGMVDKFQLKLGFRIAEWVLRNIVMPKMPGED